MTAKLTYEYVKSQIEMKGYVLLSKEYKKASEKLDLICPNGHHIQMKYNQLQQGVGCKQCYEENRKIDYNIIKSKVEEHGFELLTTKEEYVDARTKLKVRCSEGHIVEKRYDGIIKGEKCGECCRRTPYDYEYVKKYIEEEGYSLISTTYKNNYTPLTVVCPKGHLHEIKFGSFKFGNRCPICKESKGERRIAKILDNFHVEDKREYKFADCTYKGVLRFDFYIPKSNICIEYDGMQHYQPIEHFGGEERQKEDNIRDNIKTEYCKNNNIKLIRISYLDFEKIEEILKQELNLK